jgi:thioesterase domain-containing protein
MTSGANGLLGTMLRHAGESDRAGQFIELLMEASRFRPAFEWSRDRTPAGVVRLAEGEAAEPLVCFPTVVAMSGPHQFARFAKALQGVRGVAALSYPGFHAGELLPASAEDAAEAALAAVESASGDASPVLVGYSSGGILALEVALRLEQRGRPLAGVVLLDPIAADARDEGDFQPELVGRMIDGGNDNGNGDGRPGEDPRAVDGGVEDGEIAATGVGNGYVGVDDTRLTAMGGYLRMLSGCSLPSLAAPVLVAWASERIGSPEGGPALYADIEHTAVETTGDHFTLIEQHAATTARTVEEWLSDTRSPAMATKAHEKE